MSKNDQPTSPISARTVILAGGDAVMVLAAAAAISTLALEYGFYQPPVKVEHLHLIQVWVLGAFVLDRVGRLLLSRRRRLFLKENWIDFALMGGAVVVALAARRLQTRVLSAAALYVIVTQVYILAVLVVRAVGLQVRVAGTGIHPIWLLIGGFVVVILFGTCLLLLPTAIPEQAERPLGFADALFTATSATCVTGLIVRDTGSEFSRFGQVVILTLIQLGGLGIMIFGTVFALLAGRDLSVRESLVARQVLSEGTIGRIGRMVKFVVLATFVAEAAGALLSYWMWRQHDPGAPLGQTAFHTVFHAISAFCNAGFSLQKTSLTDLARYWQVIAVMAPLIVLGGLGFPVLYDLARAGWHGLRRLLGAAGPAAVTLTLHSKLVLSTSAILVLLGAGGLLAIEHASDAGQTYGSSVTAQDNPQVRLYQPGLLELAPPQQVREAVFQSVTARTAGFNTIPMSKLSHAGKFWMCLLMIIGGSPAGTAGGMKTATVAILVLAIASILRRRERIESFRRTIAESFVRKATVLAGLYLALVAASTLLLSVAMYQRRGPAIPFMDVFFEACSACGTVGLTCGVTRSLTTFGKYVIMASMFIGRLGPLTLLLALTLRYRPARYAYPNEEVVLG